MKDTVKKLIYFRVDRYEDIERKLERLASRGLFLEECSAFFWTFKRGEPQKLKYAVTFFSEGSVFNPGITDNQQTYIDYAAAAGWDFAAQMNQMQIFCSKAGNPVPFETDEREKLQNIKKCMNKSYIPSLLLLLLVFVFNLLVQYHSFRNNPIDFLSSPARLVSAWMIFAVVFYEAYILLDYLLWLRRSERSVAKGGTCMERSSLIARAVNISVMVLSFASLGYLLYLLFFQMRGPALLLCLVQVPVLMLLFHGSVKFLRKKKASALINKIVSVTLLLIAEFAYLAVIMLLILKFGFGGEDARPYRTIAWPPDAASNYVYKLYREEIPLTCEDLYGQTDYEYYSYERELDSTVFLTTRAYRQTSLPAREAPPEIEYEILETRFDFVYRLAREKLLELPKWRDKESFEVLDNDVFHTVEAYQRFYDGTPDGSYVLLFEDKIVTLNLEAVPDERQLQIIKEKLGI